MTTQHVTANGLEFAYETFGDPAAPPLLLIMGLGTQMIGWREGLCGQLADRGFFVVRFDNRDVGESTHLSALPVPNPLAVLVGRREPAYRIEDMAGDTLALMDALGLATAHVVGASMGGFIAQHVALAAPARVRTLTLIMTSTGARNVGTTSGKVLVELLRRKPAVDREHALDATVGFAHLIQSPAYRLPDDQIRAYAGVAFDRGYDAAGGTRQFGAVVGQTNRTEALAEVRIPTLVMHGLHDRLVAFSGGIALARTIPGARFVGFNGMGHDLPEALWPDYVREIGALVDRAGASTADVVAQS